MVVTRDGEVGEMWRCWSKDTKSYLHRTNQSRDSIDNTITI